MQPQSEAFDRILILIIAGRETNTHEDQTIIPKIGNWDVPAHRNKFCDLKHYGESSWTIGRVAVGETRIIDCHKFTRVGAPCAQRQVLQGISLYSEFPLAPS